MLEVVLSNQFKRDLKETLPEKYRDHNLTGKYAGFRECHVLPDWLLVYRADDTELILFLSRTGTHADLF